jgi:Alpha/beta hydrolase family
MNLLLVHGLWRTPLSFFLLARRLRRWGYPTEQFGYIALTERYEVIVSRLVARVERLARRGPYAVIGHSLGALLLRSALPRVTGQPPIHFVMLGPPNRPPRLARALGVHWIYRRITGESGINLGSPQFYARLPIPEVPYTIIAGSAGPRGRWSPFSSDLNDGLVAVGETRIRDDDPVVILPVTHTFMMNNAGVQRVIRESLRRAAGAEPA